MEWSDGEITNQILLWNFPFGLRFGLGFMLGFGLGFRLGFEVGIGLGLGLGLELGLGLGYRQVFNNKICKLSRSKQNDVIKC